MTYKIVFYSGVEKQIRRLQPAWRVRVGAAIAALASNPRPHGCRKLANRANQYRIRIGDYRVIYSIHDATVTVAVLEVDHRRDIYR